MSTNLKYELTYRQMVNRVSIGLYVASLIAAGMAVLLAAASGQYVAAVVALAVGMTLSLMASLMRFVNAP